LDIEVPNEMKGFLFYAQVSVALKLHKPVTTVLFVGREGTC